jgi:hypothetical protein
MRDFWIGMAVAQNAAAGSKAGTKPADRRYRVLSIVGGIALSLLVGGALLVVLAFNVG